MHKVARTYDAADRRFMAVDPVKGIIKEPATFTQYVYTLNNPVRNIDPTGKFSVAKWSIKCIVKFGDGTIDRKGLAVAGNGDDNVKVLQRALNYISRYAYGSKFDDGGYGNGTFNALRNYAKYVGSAKLLERGIYGPTLYTTGEVNESVWKSLITDVIYVYGGENSGYLQSIGCKYEKGRVEEFLRIIVDVYNPQPVPTTSTNGGNSTGNNTGASTVTGGGIIITYNGITYNSDNLPDPPILSSEAKNAMWTEKTRAVARIMYKLFEKDFWAIQTYMPDPGEKSDHPGKAIDMALYKSSVDSNQANDRIKEIVEWIAENRETLNISYIIYHEKILTSKMDGKTPYVDWESYYNYNSATDDTQQHRDHVHLSVKS